METIEPKSKTQEEKRPPETMSGQGVGFSLIIFGSILILSATTLVVLSILITGEVTKANAAKDEFARVLEQFDEIAVLNTRRPVATALRAEMEKSLPLSIDVPTKIFPLIRALAQQYAVSLEIVLGTETPGVIPGGSGYAFSGKADGSTPGLVNFISAVEGLDTTIQVKEWSLSPTGTANRLAFSGVIFTRTE